MADDNIPEPPRRSVRKVSQNSYIKLRNAKTELREKVRKVSEVLRKPEHERSCADRALVTKHPEIVKTSQRNAKRLKENKDRLLEIEDEPAVLAAKYEQLADLIKSSDHVVVYTGAGISTAASIPDYRGPNGVWTLLKKGQELCPQDLSDAEPTYTHMCLTKLFRIKKVKHVVSQNCDGLHLRSGFPRYSLSELHGNMYIEMCYNCAPHREYVRLFDVTERTSVRRHATSRRCRACGVNLTDTIVHFGEKGKIKSPYRWKEAVRAAKKADLILCLGSSLKVLKKYQCLWCMDKKPQQRPTLAIVNLQWTPKDDVAALKINGRCDSVMRMVMKILDEDVPDYQRELDPIFRVCTPLRASELKTTTKKILLPPAVLARPPKQTKKKREMWSEVEIPAQPDVIPVEPSEPDTDTTQLSETVTSAPSSYSTCQSRPTLLPSETLSSFSTDATIISPSQPIVPCDVPEVAAAEDNKSSPNVVELSPASSLNVEEFFPVNQAKPQQTGFLESSSNVLLNHVSSTTCVGHTEAAQASSQVQPDTDLTPQTSSSCLPTIVVVNLDAPAESTPLFVNLEQNVPQCSSPDVFSPVSSECSMLPCVTSSPVDSISHVSPFPVLFTYLSGGGQPLSIPLKSTTSPSVPVPSNKSQFGENVSLDHSYFHNSGEASQLLDTVVVSQYQNLESQNAFVTSSGCDGWIKSGTSPGTAPPAQAIKSCLTSNSLSLSPVSPAPMCVLNMDELETVYSLPQQSTRTRSEDVTLELQLPVGCEILTLDMLETCHVPLSPNWQILALADVTQPDKVSVEPVMSNLTTDNTQTAASGQTFADQSKTSTADMLTVSLDTTSQHAQHLPELTKLLWGTTQHNSSNSTNKFACHGEERKPLSPRSSEGATTPALPLPAINTSCQKSLPPSGELSFKKPQHINGYKELKVRKGFQPKNLAKGLLNHVKAERRQVGLENICCKVGNSKCSPSSLPGWFGKGLGLKKKRK